MAKEYTIRYKLDYHFETTEEEAKRFCDWQIASQTYYVRKHYRTHYMPWEARDTNGNVTERAFICIYPAAR